MPRLALFSATLLCVAYHAVFVHAYVAPSIVTPARAALKAMHTAPVNRLPSLAGLGQKQSCRNALPLMMGADAAAGKGEGKSVLIFSWFYAAPKELELVRRIYKKKGFTNIVIQESVVKEIATPRGWYRTYDKFRNSDAVSAELQASLGQNFDVVHCMSGGFLNLGLVLSSKVALKFKVLVLDSTPIMPQPKAFVRFARAYMKDHGMDFITKLLPEPVHTWIYTSRWGVGGAYVRLKHKVQQVMGIKGRRRLGEIPAEEMEEWTRWATHVAMLDRYDNMTQVTIDTVLEPATGIQECIFLYNPNDPYLNPEDVDMVIKQCPAKGVKAVIKEVQSNHIETLFRKPNVLFNAIDESLERTSSVPV